MQMGFSAPGSVTRSGAHVDKKMAKSKGPPRRVPLGPMLKPMGYYTLGQKLILMPISKKALPLGVNRGQIRAQLVFASPTRYRFAMFHQLFYFYEIKK